MMTTEKKWLIFDGFLLLVFVIMIWFDWSRPVDDLPDYQAGQHGLILSPQLTETEARERAEHFFQEQPVSAEWQMRRLPNSLWEVIIVRYHSSEANPSLQLAAKSDPKIYQP